MRIFRAFAPGRKRTSTYPASNAGDRGASARFRKSGQDLNTPEKRAWPHGTTCELTVLASVLDLVRPLGKAALALGETPLFVSVVAVGPMFATRRTML